MRRLPNWLVWHSLAILILSAGAISIVLLLPYHARVQSWVLVSAVMAAITLVAGHGVTGCWLGFLIDRTNRMSLTRLQVALWTLTIFPALFAAAISNARFGDPAPLSIAIPIEMWILMGISTATVVGTPLVRVKKTTQPAIRREKASSPIVLDEAYRLQNLENQGFDVSSFDSDEKPLVKRSPADASVSDLFRGVEAAKAAYLDLSRVQMFFVTLVLVVAYAIALGFKLAATGTIHEFPAVDAGMVALMGISHVGFIARMAVPQSGGARAD